MANGPDLSVLDEYREYMFSVRPDMKPEEYAVYEERIRNSIINATRDIGQQHVLGSPVLDILSVGLHIKLPPPHSPGLGSWRIFGNIRFCQDPDPQYGRTVPISVDAFSRTLNDSQVVDPNFPFLSLSHPCPLYNIFPELYLDIDLYEKLPRDSGHQPLIKDVISLDYNDFPDNMFDTVLLRDFDTPDVSLRVKYITFRCACFVVVNVALDVPTGQLSRQLHVSGKIFASWHHKKEDFVPHDDHNDGCNCVCLFSSYGTKVTAGEFFHLSRSTIAAPAYATLILELMLRVEGERCYHTLDFPVEDYDNSNVEFQFPSGFVGRVKMQWASEYCFDSEDEDEEETTPTGCQTKPKQVPKPICIYDTVLDLELVEDEMMEILSVYVGLNDKRNVCRLNGTIDVQDMLYKYRIFEIDGLSSTETISDGMALPIVGPQRCLRCPCFLRLDLKDDKGEEFCRGYVGWSNQLLRPPWLDKWLCSVIRGERGFASIYYALFKSAVSCNVCVFLSAPSSCENVEIRGSIFSQYDIEYSTTFEKTYLRSGLFQKGDEREPMVLEFSSKRCLMDLPSSSESKHETQNEYWIPVPLTKSAVCLPTDNTLIIDVDLSVECETVAPAGRLIGCVEFERVHKTWHKMSSGKYELFVSVDWSRIR